jgi:hypothetical protein
VRPGKRLWSAQCEDWVSGLECLIDDALRKRNIIGGFVRSGIYPINRELVTVNLPTSYPPSLSSTRQTSSLFSISNKVVTDPLFLQEWEKDSIKKQNNFIKKSKKEKKVLLDNIENIPNSEDENLTNKKTKRKREENARENKDQEDSNDECNDENGIKQIFIFICL